MAGMLLKGGLGRNLAYLAHELMGDNWRPLNVTQVRADMARIGLAPAGSAAIVDNFDDFVLGKAAKRALAPVSDPDLRELVRDYLTNASFRRDVYVRGGTALSDAERRRRLLATTFAAPRPRAKARFALKTAAGDIRFDNPTARGMLNRLAKGPATLVELIGRGADADDVLANAMILASAQQIWPVEPGRADVSALNRVVLDRLGSPGEMRLAALACGTAAPLSGPVLADLKAGATSAKGASPAWRAWLAAHGAAFGEC
jgi:hypothetical protein